MYKQILKMSVQNQSSHNNNNSQDTNKTITKCKNKSFFILLVLLAVSLILGGLFFLRINQTSNLQTHQNNQSLYEYASKSRYSNSCSVIASLGLLIAEACMEFADNQINSELLLALQNILDKNYTFLELPYKEHVQNLIDTLNYSRHSHRSTIAILRDLENIQQSISGYSVSEKKFLKLLKIQKKEVKPADIAMKNKISILIDEIKTKDMSMLEIYRTIGRDSDMHRYLSALSDEIGVELSTIAALRSTLTLTQQQYLSCLNLEKNSAQNTSIESITEDTERVSGSIHKE